MSAKKTKPSELKKMFANKPDNKNASTVQASSTKAKKGKMYKKTGM